MFITASRLSVFPFYCVTMHEDEIARPDTLLVEPRLFRTTASPYNEHHTEAADPVIPKFTVACLAVLSKRLEMNGTFAASLQEGQQNALVDLLAAGYDWTRSTREIEPPPCDRHGIVSRSQGGEQFCLATASQKELLRITYFKCECPQYRRPPRSSIKEGCQSVFG